MDSATSLLDGRKEERKPEVIVLASDGIAAEHTGFLLGQYSLSGEHQKSPYYVQNNAICESGSDSDSDSDSGPTYLYRANEKHWYVSDVLGESEGWLFNSSNSVSVPEKGWKVVNIDFDSESYSERNSDSDSENDSDDMSAKATATVKAGKYLDDPKLSVKYGVLTECGDIRVTSDGPTAKKKPDCLGIYKRTETISNGRFVFENQSKDKYLKIGANMLVWSIGDKSGYTEDIRSAAVANCPASNRNRYSKMLDTKSWSYARKSGEWREDPSIIVSCSKHSPDYY